LTAQPGENEVPGEVIPETSNKSLLEASHSNGSVDPVETQHVTSGHTPHNSASTAQLQDRTESIVPPDQTSTIPSTLSAEPFDQCSTNNSQTMVSSHGSVSSSNELIEPTLTDPKDNVSSATATPYNVAECVNSPAASLSSVDPNRKENNEIERAGPPIEYTSPRSELLCTEDPSVSVENTSPLSCTREINQNSASVESGHDHACRPESASEIDGTTKDLIVHALETTVSSFPSIASGITNSVSSTTILTANPTCSSRISDHEPSHIAADQPQYTPDVSNGDDNVHSNHWKPLTTSSLDSSQPHQSTRIGQMLERVTAELNELAPWLDKCGNLYCLAPGPITAAVLGQTSARSTTPTLSTIDLTSDDF
uniref:AF4/FMR2 family, member 2 n=1 Tax=Echinostoma caproni TaxID=27848 RepID=A0A183A481_9TREM